MSDIKLSEFFIRPAIVEDIRRRSRKQDDINRKNGTFGKITPWDPSGDSSLLRVKLANDWMKLEYGKPQPKKLFGDFWLENELCILFADTNLGKSILGVQIGNSLAQGYCMDPLANQLDILTPVLYIDFEMGSKQFESRYYHREYGSYPFGITFYRAEFNPEAADHGVSWDSFEEYLNSCITLAVMDTKAKVLIIDNITYLRSGIEGSDQALALMKHLKLLKAKYKLSVLVLAHTPKRNPAKPITVNDLQGSKLLINFCDSAFAIGESHTVKGGRYLKQIKQRNTQRMYGEDNVCLCHIRRDMYSLEFVFDGYSTESQHLAQGRSEEERQRQKEKAAQLKSQGLTYRQISAELGVGLATVHAWLSEYVS